MELDELTGDGKKLQAAATAGNTSDAPSREKMLHSAQQRAWYNLAVRVHNMWTKKGLENSRNYVDNTIVPLVMHFDTASLLPDKQTLMEVFGMVKDEPLRTATRTSRSQYYQKESHPSLFRHRAKPEPYKLPQDGSRLFDRMLPLALASASLTAFILPLYDGPIIFVLRWIMTIISVLIGPRLNDGVYPSVGVLILGFMINKPLTICTIALGAWASFFLCIVISKSLGIYHELWED